MENLELKDG